jgi:hypothetical protein
MKTTWYGSNQAAYDLAHENAIGEFGLSFTMDMKAKGGRCGAGFLPGHRS